MLQLPFLAAVIVATGAAMNAVGVPSPYLFAALLTGLTRALATPTPLTLPRPAFVASQAVTGVALGTYLQRSSLHVLADDWLAVALVSLATLALSLAAGAVLAKLTILDRPTAALGMIAGGASGIVGISDDLRGGGPAGGGFPGPPGAFLWGRPPPGWGGLFPRGPPPPAPRRGAPP